MTLTDFMSPEVYSTYVIEDGEVNKEAMKENNLVHYEGQYSTSVKIIKVLIICCCFQTLWCIVTCWMYL